MEKNEALEQINKILSQKKKEFGDIIANYGVLVQVIQEHPQLVVEVSHAYFHNLENDVFKSDTFSTSKSVLLGLIEHSSAVEAEVLLVQAAELLPQISRDITVFLKQKPEMAPFIYERNLANFPNVPDDKQSIIPRRCAVNVAAAIAYSSQNDSAEMFHRVIIGAKGNKVLTSRLFEQFGNLVLRQPNLATEVMKELRKPDYEAVGVLTYYRNVFSNLRDVMKASRDCIPEASDLFREKMMSLENDNLNAAYDALSQLSKHYPDQSEFFLSMVRQGLTSQNNTSNNAKAAYRILGDVENLKSSFSIGCRVKKDEKHPYGWKNVDSIQPNESCVVVFGGSGTRSEQAANGYAKSVQEVLDEGGLSVNVYSIAYDYGDFMEDNFARGNLKKKYKRNINTKSLYAEKYLKQENINPAYIEKIYNQVIAPRLKSSDGKSKLSEDEAAKNIRRLNLIVHCHGAYTALKLEELMQQKMKELGYNQKERNHVQQQLLILAHSPDCPLGVSMSTMVSFASIEDDEIDHCNNFHRYLNKHKKGFSLSFFEGKKGNIFVTERLSLNNEANYQEHNFNGYGISDEMSTDAKVMVAMERNIILNGVKNSIVQNDGFVPLPSIQLLSGLDGDRAPIWEKLKSRGDSFYKEMTGELQMIMQAKKQNSK